MRKVLLFSLLAGLLLLGLGVSQIHAQVYPSSPPPVASPPVGCNDDECQPELGETCETCVADCGACLPPGYELCGSGTCPVGQEYWIHCTPSCDAVPRSCYSTPSCVWPPPNCAEGGCPPGQCPANANCGPDVPVGCGVVVCNCTGGGCYSDCSACPYPSLPPGATPFPSEPPEPPSPEECIPPTTPVLSSPANGSNTASDVIMVWNPVNSWGTNPDGNNNTYRVYLDSNPSPTTLRCYVDEDINFCAISGLLLGETYYWKVEAHNGCLGATSSVWSFTVSSFRSAWYQTQEGDVHATGVISSNIPNNREFCREGDGGTPGVVSYGFSAYFGSGDVSSKGWLANTIFTRTRSRYSYFENLLADDDPTEITCHPCRASEIEGETQNDGIYKRTGGNLRIRNTDDGVFNVQTRKIVILVDGDLILNAQVRLNNDNGFVAFIVKGDVRVGGSSLTEVGNSADLEGVYLVDGIFDLGDSSERFRGLGTFVAGAFDLTGRDLGDANDTTPAFLFMYNPSLWFNAPKALLGPSFTWQELPP